jgi:hypothetical protein
MDQPPDNLKQAALWWAIRGYRVFPCAPRSKRPITEHGFKDATTDLAAIEAAWTANPEANIGLATGNGLLVIDPDKRNGGDVKLAELEAVFGPLPRDFVVKTSDGFHIYLQWDEAKPRKPKSWQGIDVKTDGGYVMAAPSVHPSGAIYTIVAAGKPARVPEIWAAPLRANATVDEDTDGEPAAMGACREYIFALPDSVSGEFGHNAVLLAATSILRHGIVGPVGYKLLREWNDTKCFGRHGDGELYRYPWSDVELKHKWSEASKLTMADGSVGSMTQAALASADFDFEVVAQAKDAEGIPRVMSYSELSKLDVHVDYIVEGVLCKGQPGFIGGREKTCKTGVSLDLVLSMHTGLPFLNRFKVNTKARSIFYTAEIGWAVAKERFLRICKAKGIDPGGIDTSFISDKMPQFDEKGLPLLEAELKHYCPEVAIFDPLYQGLSKADGSKLFEMGSMLGRVGELCRKYGVTPIFNHHAKKGAGQESEQMTLNDLHGAGIAEYARQWMLLAHVNPYNRGLFDLWLNIGGSAGHFGAYRLTIDEGFNDGAIDARRWEPTVTDAENYDRDAEIVFDILPSFGDIPVSPKDLSYHCELSEREVFKACQRLCASNPPKALNMNGSFLRCPKELQ